VADVFSGVAKSPSNALMFLDISRKVKRMISWNQRHKSRAAFWLALLAWFGLFLQSAQAGDVVARQTLVVPYCVGASNALPAATGGQGPAPTHAQIKLTFQDARLVGIAVGHAAPPPRIAGVLSPPDRAGFQPASICMPRHAGALQFALARAPPALA
jgi:hypothetical protein